MAADKEKLYETLGELIYVIAQADGLIQDSEIALLEEIIANHPWGATIGWSFNYELNKDNDVEDLYKKVINTCQDYGPSPEYAQFIEIMNAVASASEGIDDHEDKAIANFSKDLIERFSQDTEPLR